jgi:uncharacterized protein YlxP (DUF503 family)
MRRATREPRPKSRTVVGLCTMELQIPSSLSLKDKRQVLQGFIARIRNEFNVSVAEVDHQDSWQLATVAVAAVSNDEAYLHGLLEHVVHKVEGGRLDLVLLDYSIEFV